MWYSRPLKQISYSSISALFFIPFIFYRVALVVTALDAGGALVGHEAGVAVADGVPVAVDLAVGVPPAGVLAGVDLLVAHVVPALLVVVLAVGVNLTKRKGY